jgi:hypothetical protein
MLGAVDRGRRERMRESRPLTQKIRSVWKTCATKNNFTSTWSVRRLDGYVGKVFWCMGVVHKDVCRDSNM